MFRRMLFIISFVLILSAVPSFASGRILFERHKGSFSVFASDLHGGGITWLFKGVDAEISKDGKFVIYTMMNQKSGARHIAIYDMKLKRSAVLKNIPGDNSFGARLSNDGTMAAFNIFSKKGHWDIGIYDTPAKKFTYFSSPVNNGADGLYSPFWSNDGKYIYAQDLNKLYRYSLSDKSVREELSFADILGKDIAMDSGVSFTFSPDGKMLLFAAESSRENCSACASEAAPLKGILFAYLPAEKKCVRLSPENLCVHSGTWSNSTEVIFSAHKSTGVSGKLSGGNNIYKMSIKDKKPTLLIKDGYSPTCGGIS